VEIIELLEQIIFNPRTSGFLSLIFVFVV